MEEEPRGEFITTQLDGGDPIKLRAMFSLDSLLSHRAVETLRSRRVKTDCITVATLSLKAVLMYQPLGTYSFGYLCF